MPAAPDTPFSKALKAVEAGRIASLYLLHGDEELLQEDLLARIQERLLEPSAADFNRERLDAEECSAEDIRNAVNTLPFLGGRRLVVIRRAEMLREKVEALEPLLENLPESACLVLTTSSSKGTKESEPAKESKESKESRARRRLLEKVRKFGVVVPTDPLKDDAFKTWVRQAAARLGFALDPEALALLAERSGGSLGRARSELEKLALHLDGEPGKGEEAAPPRISLEKVAEVVDDGRTESLFALTDALGARNAAEALEALERLLGRQHNATAIVAFLSRHLVRLLEARALLDEGVPAAAVPKSLGGHPFYAGKLADQASRFTDPELRAALGRLQQADVLLKGGGPPDRVLLEQVALDLCRMGGEGEKAGLRKRRPSAAGRGRAG